MWQEKDRRRHKRIKTHFIIRFNLEQEKGTGSGDWNMVTARDLGAGGALFNYDKKIGLGTIIKMKIDFPAFGYPISCKGKIIRVDEPGTSGNIYRIAVIFTEINETDREIINITAEEISEKREENID